MVVSSLIVGFLNLNNVLGGSYWPKSDNHRLKGYMSYMSNKPKYKTPNLEVNLSKTNQNHSIQEFKNCSHDGAQA
jgi:hypothetical protein